MANKNFVIMVIGQIISVLGAALLRFALSLYVLDETGRADLFALLLAISSVPVLLAPFGGALADRFNRRNLMVVFDFLSSIVVFTFYTALLINHSSIFLITIVMILLAILSTLYAPTVLASIPLLVEEKKLEQANGIVNGIQALSNTAAPILGGIVYGILGLKILVLVSGIFFLLSAVLELFLYIPFVQRQQSRHMLPTLINDMKEGFHYVVKQSFILQCMVFAALLNLFLTPLFIVGIPIVLRMTMQSSETLYGVGMGLIDFATILGALSMGIFAKKLAIHKLYYWLLVAAICTIPMGLSLQPLMLESGFYSSYVLLVVSALCIAIILTILSIYVMTLVQKETPNIYLGKVMAIIMMVSQCVAPIGQILYGLLFAKFNDTVSIPILIIGLLLVLLAIAMKKIWRYAEGGLVK
ncbi:MFS transporter [Lysinibacillus piscis]|uniref:MFS transporter n=1 Tax=Lysinibacillus piscis TaxID=2518931 RepID=A0ABQ5NH50_9BACI|nr:MFS transporter [Lysinibacillus sp. KH24]GLC87686.1 MFS transporter [Lysinibacillus sp. KH24]